MSKNVHVIPHDDGWAVKTEGSERAVKVHDTQNQAIEHGRDIAKNNKSELLIHGRDGQIRERNTYGSDPHPPKG